VNAPAAPGRTVVAGPLPRVVSLVPSLTESLIAWGVTPVACTKFCEHPELPHVGGTKDPDLDAIVALRPDLVVMCEEENLLAHHEALVGAGLRCHSVRIDGLADVAPQLAGVAAAVGVDAPAIEPLDAVPVAAAARRRAFVPIWRRPWMTLSAGTYGSSLLAGLGVDNVFADEDGRYPTVTLEEVAARRPDVVLLPSEPYPFKERHRALFHHIAPAAVVDGQDLFWWGVRTPAAQRRLAVALADIGVAPGAVRPGEAPPPSTSGGCVP
jgi:ABC-type Fe3+-hydroxamate transport system substrate-binding protein